MNAPNIIPLTPPERGVCSVCDGRYRIKKTETVRAETSLVVVDKTTGIKAGECCRIELLRADDALNYHGARFGICHHPTQL